MAAGCTGTPRAPLTASRGAVRAGSVSQRSGGRSATSVGQGRGSAAALDRRVEAARSATDATVARCRRPDCRCRRCRRSSQRSNFSWWAGRSRYAREALVRPNGSVASRGVGHRRVEDHGVDRALAAAKDDQGTRPRLVTKHCWSTDRVRRRRMRCRASVFPAAFMSGASAWRQKDLPQLRGDEARVSGTGLLEREGGRDR